MALRKRKRFRRPAVRTLEDFNRASFDYTYGGQGGNLDALGYFFGGDEQAARDFWATWGAEFMTMRRPGDPRELRLIHHEPGRRCWPWWLLESPEPPDFDSVWATAEIEYRQLARMGEIRPEEIEALTVEAVEADKRRHDSALWNGWQFRRPWTWWEFVSPAPRDASVFESSQLVKLRELTSLEKRILDNPREALTVGFGCAGRGGMRFYYLDRAERELLGLTEFHNGDEAAGVVPVTR